MKSGYIYQLKAAKCFGKGDYKSAVGHFKKSMEVEGESSYIYSIIASCYELDEEYELAVKNGEKAVILDKEQFGAYEVLSRVHCSLKNYEKAKEYVIKGIECYPEPLPGPPKFVYFLLKMISIIPKFRRVYESTKEELSNPNRSSEKWYKWAKEYLEWYENAHGEKSVPTVH